MRHDRVFLYAAGWEDVLRRDPTLAEDPEVIRWLLAGWPLVRRRPLPGDVPDLIPLGLPLPPRAGARRRALQVAGLGIRAVLPALDLAEVWDAAPATWQPSLDVLAASAARHGQRIQVFGSLAWAAITRLPYLTPQSDLDLMVAVVPPVRPEAWLDDLGSVARLAPMRIDAEFVRPDGAALSWHEADRAEALVKLDTGSTLMTPAAFWAGRSS